MFKILLFIYFYIEFECILKVEIIYFNYKNIFYYDNGNFFWFLCFLVYVIILLMILFFF